jgi:WD40 repeat protein
MPIPLPVLAGTPVPQPVAATSPENADRVVQLARWSQDRVSNEDLPGWSPQGTWLFVPSTMGVRLYSNDDFTNYRLIETGKHPTFSPDEKFIASAVNPPGTIRLTDVQSGDMVKEWRPHDAAITDLWFRGDILFSRDENDVLVANDFTADPPAELLRTQVGDGEIFTLSDGSTLIEVDTDLTQQPPTQRLQICRVSENRCESGTNVDMGLDGLLLGISPDFTENQGSVVIWKNNGEVVAQNAFGQEISTLGIYTDTTTIPNVRISPHGKYVVIGNEIRRIQDGQVIATGETLANQLGQDYPVYLELASFSPDEHYLAVVELPVDGLLLNLGDGEIYSLRPPEILSSGMTPPPTFRPDSQEVMFAVIGPGGSIRVFSTADGNVKGEIDAKSANAILRMAFTSAGDLAVLYPAELQIRSLHDGQILRTIRHNAGLDIALMEDGFYSKSDSSYDKIEYLFTPYNTQQPSRKMVFQRAPEEATGYNYTVYYSSLDVSRGFLFTFSPDHRYLIREAPHEASEGSRESIVVLYDVNHPEPIRTALPRPGGGYLSKLVFAPDSSLLAIGLEKEVILLSIPDMNIVGQQTTENEITGLAFALDGKTIAIATESAQVLLWNFERGTLERLDTQAEKNRTPTFSADGRLLAIVVPDGIQLWDVSARQLLRTLEAPDVVSLAFSPDQKLLVAGAEQDVIYLWGVR